jgi:hypothetical protein
MLEGFDLPDIQRHTVGYWIPSLRAASVGPMPFDSMYCLNAMRFNTSQL